MGKNATGNPVLAAVLRQYRERTGLSQSALATATKLDASTVHKIEAGTRGIGLDTLVALSSRLGPRFREDAERAMVDGHY